MPKIYQILTVDVNGTFKYYVCLRKPLITFVWDKIVAAIFYVLFFCVAFFRGCGKEFVKQAPIVLDQAGWQKIG